jgi:ribosome-associated heat shock protein Hsp15
MRRAQARAIVTGRSIPIRLSPNWRRSRSNSPPAARNDFAQLACDWLIARIDALERQRLDKWLWHARVVKARTSAAALVEAGRVRINGVRETAPGHAVKAGDVLTIGLDRSVRLLKVIGFAERRGNASSARTLYVDLQDRQE